MGRPHHVIILALLISSASCAHRSASGGRASNDIITRADIEKIHAATALDAVSRYRGDILVTKGPSSIYLDKQTHPVVFTNATYYGKVDELKNIPADGIGEIRFFRGVDAVRLFGAQYGGGVIQIVSRVD
jgi:outer membrane cobalamin receptor